MPRLSALAAKARICFRAITRLCADPAIPVAPPRSMSGDARSAVEAESEPARLLDGEGILKSVPSAARPAPAAPIREPKADALVAPAAAQFTGRMRLMETARLPDAEPLPAL